MDRPIEVDLPHSIGREEARRRIAANVHKLSDQLPGAADVQSSWTGDTLNLAVTALGQSVAADIKVEERLVHVRVRLPGLLAMFAAPIEAALNSKGRELLLEDKGTGR